MGHDETDAVQAEVRDRCRVTIQLDGAGKVFCVGLLALGAVNQLSSRNSVCPTGRRGARGSPVNWPRKLMGRLHKAHTGQFRGHPIGAPPTLQTASARAFSGFRTDQVGKRLSIGYSLQLWFSSCASARWMSRSRHCQEGRSRTAPKGSRRCSNTLR